MELPSIAILGPIGAVVSVFVFNENAQAHGVGGAALRETPVLGDFIGFADTVDEEAACWLQSLNRHVAEGHRRAVQQFSAIVEYELSTRQVDSVDLNAVRLAMSGLYNELQSAYYLEAASGRPANINNAVLEFQEAVRRAVSPTDTRAGNVGGSDYE